MPRILPGTWQLLNRCVASMTELVPDLPVLQSAKVIQLIVRGFFLSHKCYTNESRIILTYQGDGLAGIEVDSLIILVLHLCLADTAFSWPGRKAGAETAWGQRGCRTSTFQSFTPQQHPPLCMTQHPPFLVAGPHG